MSVTGNLELATEHARAIIAEVNDRNDSIRRRGSKRLREYVELEAREMTGDVFSHFLNTIIAEIYDIVNSSDPDKLGCILMINELIDVACNENEKKAFIRFASYLRVLIQQFAPDTDPVTLELAAQTLGHLARAGGSLTSVFVEFEVKRALEWLQSDHIDARRHVAVLILKELADNAPALFYVHVPTFFAIIWRTMRDTKLKVREAASDALASCLVLVRERQNQQTQKFYGTIFNLARDGLAMSTDCVHGALLTYQRMLQHAESFMKPRFNEMCESVLRFKDHKHPLIRATVLMLLPLLAKFCPEKIIGSYLDTCITHLLESLKRHPQERPTAYEALGRIARVVRAHIAPRLPQIMDMVKSGLQSRRGHPFCPEALSCLEMLAMAVGPALEGCMDGLQDRVFSGGLSRHLIPALRALGDNIPALLPSLQDRLVSELVSTLFGASTGYNGGSSTIRRKLTLLGTPVASSGRKRSWRTRRLPGTGGGGGSESLRQQQQEREGVLCALNALQTFDFRGRAVQLLPLVQSTAMAYLEHELADVRVATVLACAKLLDQADFDTETTTTALRLRLGGAESDSDISSDEERPATSSSVADSSEHVNRHINWKGESKSGVNARRGPAMSMSLASVANPLSGATAAARSTTSAIGAWRRAVVQHGEVNNNPQAEGLLDSILERLLVAALADRDPAVRRTVLQSLGPRMDARLALAHNLSSLLLLLQDEDFHTQMAAVAVVGRLASSQSALTLPAMRSALTQLLMHMRLARDSRLREEGALLLGALTAAAGRVMRPYVTTVLMELIPLIQKGSSPVVTATLSTLGELCLVDGGAIAPYLDQLLPLVCRAVSKSVTGDTGHAARQLAVRALGRLVSTTGCAVEPYRRFPALLDCLLKVLGSGTVPWSLRREAMKTLGVLGAFDPLQYKAQLASQRQKKLRHCDTVNPGDEGAAFAARGSQSASPTRTTTPSGDPDGGSRRLEDRCPRLAVQALLDILRRPSLSSHHTAAVSAVMLIARTLHAHVVPLLPLIIPRLLAEVEKADGAVGATGGGLGGPDSFLALLLQSLSQLVWIARHDARDFLPGILKAISRHWSRQTEQVLSLVDNIARVFRAEFQMYLPSVIHKLLAILSNRSDSSPSISVAASPTSGSVESKSAGSGSLFSTSTTSELLSGRQCAVLVTLEVLAPTLGDYLYLVIPALLRLIQAADVAMAVRQQALASLDIMCGGRDPSMYELAAALTLTGGSGAEDEDHTEHILGLDISQYALRILHPLARVLDRPHPPCVHLRPLILETLCTLVYKLGSTFAPFLPTVARVLARHSIRHPLYSILEARSVKNQSLPPRPSSSLTVWDENLPRERAGTVADDGPHARMPPPPSTPQASLTPLTDEKMKALRRAWEVGQRSTAEDWEEWMRRFSVELLKRSPSPPLRACSSLAQVYEPLARQLFNISFVCAWSELNDAYQEHLIHSLEAALQSPDIPPKLLHVLLNLAEFMEQDERPLPIDVGMLGQLAEACHAYAKALRYKEVEFQSSQELCLESLVSINHQLNQPEAASGVLEYAQRYHAQSLRLQEGWFEKLGRWDEALAVYEQKCRTDPSPELALGRMRCLEALGDWQEVAAAAAASWDSDDDSQEARDSRLNMSALSARAAWALSDWESMATYVAACPEGSWEGPFLSAVLAIHSNQLDDAERSVECARRQLSARLSALVGESYNRAYPSVVKVQQLAEMEEIIAYKRLISVGDSAEAERLLVQLRSMWNSRLANARQDLKVYLSCLSVRSLLLPPNEDLSGWLAFARVCRRQCHFGLSQLILVSLGAIPLGSDEDESSDSDTPLDATTFAVTAPSSTKQHAIMLNGKIGAHAVYPAMRHSEDLVSIFSSCRSGAFLAPHPRVSFEYLCHMWDAGEQEEAISRLTPLVGSLDTFAHSEAAEVSYLGHNSASLGSRDLTELRAHAHRTLGEWQLAVTEHSITEQVVSEALKSMEVATSLDSNSHAAWHSWAVTNFQALQHHKKYTEGGASAQFVTTHLLPAIRGFFRSVSLVRSHSLDGGQLQDILRLLTLWFDFGHRLDVVAALEDGFRLLPIDTWLQVVPQLIARINTADDLVSELLFRVGNQHPQALIYPLTVAAKSTSESRKRAALSILRRLRRRYSSLVDQAQLVSQELIRVAILWHEMWHEALEDASKLFFTERNIPAMLQRLEPLHHLMARGPETQREVSFHQAFGRDLARAQAYLTRYRANRNEAELNAAWELYFVNFRKISAQLGSLKSLDLQYVSPALAGARQLELAVPGTYAVDSPTVLIRAFRNSVSVFSSKQRPRKISILGSDGQQYPFLLKGHEDLRQDERVMQLFGLVNGLLAKDAQTGSRELSIQRYSVIPLSNNAGIVGWVPHCDTLHATIQGYRVPRKISMFIEYGLMLKMVSDHKEPTKASAEFDKLSVVQKVEVLEYALEKTAGKDLAKMLWLKSANSEMWLDRRTNYTRSLAVMSMVGYILGLGDRHPSNLMLHRFSGRIVHIDFGDCFEVAIHRDKYPEQVPFRLTRLLVNAMEASGIEGNFRSTCESVMSVIRDHRGSVMSMLEAFVHDPLINWRILAPTSGPSSGVDDSPTVVVGGVSVAAADVDDGEQKTDLSVTLGPQTYKAAVSGGTEQEHTGGAALNERAVQVTQRIHAKLTGRDFSLDERLSVRDQVGRLIAQATSPQNLAQCYLGWCPYW